ncbi:antiterminator, partial [Klebsiella quasivariicola]
MKMELTNEQHQWIDQWLQLWGAWCQTGKIDKAMINMIAKFMATVEPQAPSRPVCSDDDGLLIDAVIRHYLKNVDENAWKVIFAYYVC